MFATRDPSNSRLYTDTCRRTHPIAPDARDELTALDQLTQEQTVLLTRIGVMAAATFALLAIFFLRYRRPGSPLDSPA